MDGVLGESTRIPLSATGRYARVQLADTGILSLAEVMVMGYATAPPENIAPLGAASQSSTSNGGAPARAIDGNTSGVLRNGSVTHTQSQSQPWWELHLERASVISEVVLHNRTDNCCMARLSDVHVFVSPTPMTGRSFNELRADSSVFEESISGAVGASATLTLDAIGEYVRVQLAGSNATLSLAEVEVIGWERN